MTASIDPRDLHAAILRAITRSETEEITPFMVECFRLIDAIHNLIDAEHAKPHELMEAWRVVEVRAEWLGKAVWKLPVDDQDGPA